MISLRNLLPWPLSLQNRFYFETTYVLLGGNSFSITLIFSCQNFSQKPIFLP
ncbi:hypothetical protein LEP1GSC195_1851 [Leptospira wolbachii serovar Codice str. CDC]|uniref:Uncharacterized protein n=1 Tax=Leptospira wolbachii serovar Codice str. CDC TaxID=1218599 RepID=R9A1N7_9LEPT|nr:hypothetical protein LEP1GSC195_1851 [Leptospira wolbachii serovar Codice str. CDC]